MENLITVIIPIYKVEKYLRKCVDSVTAQTHKNLEIILVDDGSPDGCGEICDEYAKRDERIKVIHKENGGLSDARNAGLDIASGEYIGFVDSDDYIAPDMYEVMLKRLTETDADMAVCNVSYVGDVSDNQRQSEKVWTINDCVLDRKEAMRMLEEIKNWRYVTAWNKLYKRNIFRNIRFPKGKIHEDEFVAHRVIGECEKIACISQRLYYYLQRQGSIMAAESLDAKLDTCEALIDRARYCLSIRYSAQASYFLKNGSGFLMFICRKYPKETEVRRRYKSIHKDIRRLYGRMFFKKMPLETRVALTFGCMGMKPYNMIHKIAKGNDTDGRHGKYHNTDIQC